MIVVVAGVIVRLILRQFRGGLLGSRQSIFGGLCGGQVGAFQKFLALGVLSACWDVVLRSLRHLHLPRTNL
jgi:hypothetical protein